VASDLKIDLNASTQKLRERAVRIVQVVTCAEANAVLASLETSKCIVKIAWPRLM